MHTKRCAKAAEELLKLLRAAPTTHKAYIAATGPGTMCAGRHSDEPDMHVSIWRRRAATKRSAARGAKGGKKR